MEPMRIKALRSEGFFLKWNIASLDAVGMTAGKLQTIAKKHL